MSVLSLAGRGGEAILAAARGLAAVEKAGPSERAAAVAAILETALEPGHPLLLQSALFDALRTPGAMERLDGLDADRMLQRFHGATPGSDLQLRLLDAFGTVRPAGLGEELLSLVRGPGGAWHREQVAALLASLNDGTVAGALVRDFRGLAPEARANVLHVLGCMGQGRGVEAIREALDLRCSGTAAAAVRALFLDRSPAAAGLLGEIAAGRDRQAALAAVAALARIGSEASRAWIDRLAGDPRVDPAVRAEARRRAAEAAAR